MSRIYDMQFGLNELYSQLLAEAPPSILTFANDTLNYSINLGQMMVERPGNHVVINGLNMENIVMDESTIFTEPVTPYTVSVAPQNTNLTMDMLRDAAIQIANSAGMPDQVFMNPRSFAQLAEESDVRRTYDGRGIQPLYESNWAWSDNTEQSRSRLQRREGYHGPSSASFFNPLEAEKLLLYKSGISADKIQGYYMPFDGKEHTKDGLFYCCEECSAKWG